MKDVMECINELPFTEDSYIVGSAPCVVDHLDKVPRDCFTVALNGAYVLRDYWDAWAIWRRDSTTYPWWPDQRPNVGSVICGETLAGCIDWADYSFKYEPPLTVHEYPREGICHGGATIAGSMFLMLCASPRVHRIHFCGVQMTGPIDFDGCSTQHGNEPVWQQFAILVRMIGWARRNLRGVYSVHPTTFDQYLGAAYG